MSLTELFCSKCHSQNYFQLSFSLYYWCISDIIPSQLASKLFTLLSYHYFSDITSNDVASQLANEFLTQLSNQIVNDLARSVDVISVSNTDASPSNEMLTFHQKCGSLIKLTNDIRTAERKRPLDEFNNGVVMTNRPIKNDEMFEVCFIPDF